MRSNLGQTAQGITISNKEEDMAAMELLPRVVRDALNEAAMRFSAAEILEVLRTHNVSPTQLAAALRSQGSRKWQEDWKKAFGYDYLTGRPSPSS
jgi:hypothetical protein